MRAIVPHSTKEALGLHVGRGSGGRNQSELEATDPRRAERLRPTYDNPGRKQKLAIASYPTLRQAWSGECPGPQCAFKMSMFNVSCNSH